MIRLMSLHQMTSGGSLLAMARVREKDPPPHCFFFEDGVIRMNPADTIEGKKYRMLVGVCDHLDQDICWRCAREVVVECHGGTLHAATGDGLQIGEAAAVLRI